MSQVIKRGKRGEKVLLLILLLLLLVVLGFRQMGRFSFLKPSAQTSLPYFIFTHPVALKCFFSHSLFWPHCYLAHICLNRKKARK